MSEPTGKNNDRVAPLEDDEEADLSSYKLAQQVHDINDDESKSKTDTITAAKDTEQKQEKNVEAPGSFEQALRKVLEIVRSNALETPTSEDRSCRFMGERAKLLGFDKNTGAAIIGRSDTESAAAGRPAESRAVATTGSGVKDETGRNYTRVDLGNNNDKLYADPSGSIFTLKLNDQGQPVLERVPGVQSLPPTDPRLEIARERPSGVKGEVAMAESLRPWVAAAAEPVTKFLEQLGSRLDNTRERSGAPEAPSPFALVQSNEYATQHALGGRLRDGFATAGQNREFNRDGSFNAADRAATVVDRSRDVVLQRFIEEAKQQFGHLPPQERARALAEYVNKVLGPADGNEQRLDADYRKLMTDNAGKSLLLGDFAGKGACGQRALLLKVLADEMGLEASLVRGNGGSHAWTTFNFGDGKQLIYDPRAKVYGVEASSNHRPLEATAAAARDFAPGQEVNLRDKKWQVAGYDEKDGRIILERSEKRSTSEAAVVESNPGKDLTVGQKYKLPAANGGQPEEWTLQGRNSDGSLRFSRTEQQAMSRKDLSAAVLEMAGPEDDIKYLKDNWKTLVEDNTSLDKGQRDRLTAARDALESTGSPKAADFKALIGEISKLSKSPDKSAPERIKSLTTIAEVVGNYPNTVHMPIDKVIGAQNIDALKQVAESFAQSAPHTQQAERQVDGQPMKTGDGYEHPASQALQKALSDKAAVDKAIKSGKLPAGEWVFVPSAKGATADDLKIDGMMVDMKTGKVIFIDFAMHQDGTATPYGTLDKKLRETYGDGTVKRPWALTLDCKDIGWDGKTGAVSGKINADKILTRVGEYTKGTQPAAVGSTMTQAVPHVYDVAGLGKALGGFPNFAPVQGELDAQLKTREGSPTKTRQAELAAIEKLKTNSNPDIALFGKAASSASDAAQDAYYSFGLVHDGLRAAVEADKYGVLNDPYKAKGVPDVTLSVEQRDSHIKCPAKYANEPYISIKADDTKTAHGTRNPSEIRVYKNGDVVVVPYGLKDRYVPLGNVRDLGDQLGRDLVQQGLDPKDFSKQIKELGAIKKNFAAIEADIKAIGGGTMTAEKFWEKHPELRLLADGTQHGKEHARAAREARPLYEAKAAIEAHLELGKLPPAEKEAIAAKAVALGKAGQRGLTLGQVYEVMGLEKLGLAEAKAVEATRLKAALGAESQPWTPTEVKEKYEALKQKQASEYPKQTNLADVHLLEKLRERLATDGTPISAGLAEQLLSMKKTNGTSDADMMSIGKMYERLRRASMKGLSLENVRQLNETVKDLSVADAAEMSRVANVKAFKTADFKTIAEFAKRNLALETTYGVDAPTARKIRDQAEAQVKGGAPLTTAHDVAFLIEAKGMPPAEATAMAGVIAELRAQKDRSFETLHNAAQILTQADKIADPKIRAEFRDMLAECIKETGGDPTRLRQALADKTFTKATSGGAHETEWANAYDAVEKSESCEKLLSLSIDKGKQQAALETVFESSVAKAKAESRTLAFDTTGGAGLGPIKLDGVNKSLLDADLVGRFADKVETELPNLTKAGAEERLKNMIADFFKEEGIKDESLSKDKLQVVISEDAKAPSVEFRTTGDKPVERRGAEFFMKGTNDKVEPGTITSVLTVPKALLKEGHPLAGALYRACIEASDRGEASVSRSRAITADVVTSLAKHANVPEHTFIASAGAVSGLDASSLPTAPAKPVEITLGETGVKIAGIENELTFKDIWKDRIDKLEEQLKDLKKDGDKNKDLITEKETEIAHEKTLLAGLESDTKSAAYDKSVAEAKERLKDICVTDRELDRVARDRAIGDRVRGRFVAVTIILGLVLAKTTPAHAAAPKKEPPKPKSDKVSFAAPETETMTPTRAGTGLNVATPTGGIELPKDAPAPPKDALAPPKDAPAPPKDAPAPPKDAAPPPKDAPALPKDAPAKVDDALAGKLSDVPNAELTKAAFVRMLPEINSLITKENVLAKAKDPAAVDRPIVDQTKLKAEWDKGEFGPESRKLWREAQHYVERRSLSIMGEIDSRGLPFPPGAPVGPGMSTSGTQLREGDELFRTRLRTGQVDLKFGFENLKPGEIPKKDDVDKLLNAVIFLGRAGQQLTAAYVEGQASAVQFNVDSNADLFRPGVVEGWKKPENATQEQLERWSTGTTAWLGTANRVRFYAEAVASLNAATTTRGMDFPSLSKAVEMAFGVGNDKKVFPDAALKDFPGEVKRDENGRIVSLKLDLPDSPERTEANLAKIAKFEKWLAQYGPAVDQVFKELAKIMADSDRMLLWAENGEVETTKKITGTELAEMKEKHPNAKVNDRVALPNGDKDYCIKEIKSDGSWVLEARAPNGQPFNLKRYGFEVVTCDRDGKVDPKGQFRKVQGYQDYFWARDFAYNNWNINALDLMGPTGSLIKPMTGDTFDAVKKVDRKVTNQPAIHHEDDFVPILDNGRMRLMQAKNLNSWANAAETGKQAGNVATLLVDVGMLVTGLGEFRAAYAIAKKGGEMAMKEFAKQILKATWHTGLGLTGFGKQAIVNEVPYGRELMTARHVAILADLSFQLLPSASQQAVWAKLWGKSEGVEIGAQWMAGVGKAGKEAAWIDKALIASHKAFEGKQFIAWTPKVGIFPMCDYYFLAQFTDVLRVTRPGEEDQRERLVDAALKYGRERVGKAGRPDMAGEPPVEEMRKLTQNVLGDYGNLISPARGSENPAARELDKAVAETKQLAAGDPKRAALLTKLAATYHDSKSSQAEFLAASRGILDLSKNAENKHPERIRIGTREFLTTSLQRTVDRHPHTVAAQTPEIAKLPVDAPERVAYRNRLAETYGTTFNKAEKLAAAQALAALAVDAAGKPTASAGQFTKAGNSETVATKDVEAFLSGRGPGLLKRAEEALFLPDADAKRVALGNDALKIRTTDSEEDQLAAAMVLMSLRHSDNPTEKLGNAQAGVSAETVWNNLKRLSASCNPDVRLAAGDFMLRTSRAATADVAGQQRILADLEAQLKLKPADADLRIKTEQAKASFETSKNFQNLTSYEYVDYAGLLMSVMKDPKASRQTRLDAMVSPNGPRLGMILEQLKHQIEPAISAEQDGGKKFNGQASLYGRDAFAIEKMLREIAANGQQDPDIRAMASRLIGAAETNRPTINGVGLASGVELKIGSAGEIKLAGDKIAADHARIRLGNDGRLMIRDMGTTGGTTIIRADGKEEKVSGYTQINPGDRVIVGTKETGKELVIGTESLQKLALAAADATTLVKPGQLAEDNRKRILKDLTSNTEPGPGISAAQRIEARAVKLRAAEAALELGPSGMGMDEATFKKTVGTALTDTIRLENAEIAKRALQRLTPDLIASLDVARIDGLRETSLQVLSNNRKDVAAEALRLEFIARSGDIFANATKEQKARLANICECVLLAGAQPELVTKDKDFSYPTFGNATPEYRAAAVKALASLDPDRGAEVAKMLLLGGEDRGAKVERDTPSVRLASAKALAEISPPDLQATALKGMRLDTDPRVLAELSKIEYGSRRPDLDPIRLDAEIRSVRSRLGDRAKQGDFADAKAHYEQLLAANKGNASLAFSQLQREATTGFVRYSGEPFTETGIKARKTLLWLAAEGPTGASGNRDSAANYLRDIVDACSTDPQKRNKIAAELVPGLELGLQSGLRVPSQVKSALLNTYISLKPGENGIVSAEEAAIVLGDLLKQQRTDKNPYDDLRTYQGNISLQQDLIEHLTQLKSDKTIPILLSIAGGESVRSFDAQGRPTTSQSGATTRQFTYAPGPGATLNTFTEAPPGKIYTRVGNTKEYRAPDGSVVQDAHMVSKESPMEATPWIHNEDFNSFKKTVIGAQSGDFRYTKDGVQYVVKPSGTVISEDLKADSRKVTITYPDKTSREFDFRKDAGNMKCTVTTQPGGNKDTWTIGFGSPSPLWTGANGLSPVNMRGLTGDKLNGHIPPFEFTEGHYAYVKDQKTFFAAVDGSEFETGLDHRTSTLKQGTLPADAHPDPLVRQAAATALTMMRESTTLPRQRAVDEIESIKKRQQEDPKFVSSFGPKASSETIADEMAKALSNSSTDARSVVTALYKGMLSKPIEGEKDPRLVILRAALTDGNDLVRLAASKLLAGSTVAGDKERAYFAAADLSKNTGYAGIQREATAFLDEQKTANAALVDRALAETPSKPRTPSAQAGMDFDLAAGRDVRFQRAFEQIKVTLLEGQQQYLRWNGQDWANYCKANPTYAMLTLSGYNDAGSREVASYDQNRGSMSKMFDSKETTKKAHDEARLSVIPKMWAQFDTLIKDAMEKSDTDPQGQAARRALVYIAASRGDGMCHVPGVKEEAQKRACDAILRMCKGTSPGRGDFEGPLVSLITRGDLPLELRKTLVDALDALGGPQGKTQNETIASTAAIALERDFRGMSKPGQPGYNESVAYQQKLLDVIRKYGNQELAPAIEFIGQNHTSSEVRAKALQVNAEIKTKADRGSQRVVDAMLSDTSGTRKFTPIAEKTDARISLLTAALNNDKLPEAQRLRAAQILIAPTSKGVTDDQKQAAVRAYADLGLKTSVGETTRLDVASTILDHTKTQFTKEQQEKAAAVMGALTFATDRTTAEKALAATQKLTGTEAREAFAGILQSLESIKANKTSVDRTHLAAVLDGAGKLYSGSDHGAASQQQLIQAVKYAGDLLGGDHATTKALMEMLSKDITDGKVILSGPTDARVQGLADLLAAPNRDLNFIAAKLLLDSPVTTNDAQKQAACAAVLDVASNGTGASKTNALQALRNMDAATSVIAMESLLASLKKEKVVPDGLQSQLEHLPTLFEKAKEDPKAEAAIFRAIPFAKEGSVKEDLYRLVDRCSSQNLRPIVDARDPRIPAMKAAIESNDGRLGLSASMALLHKDSKGVEAPLAVDARKTVYRQIDQLLRDVRALEQRPDTNAADKAAAWTRLDRVLENMGEKPEDYGRTYVTSKRLESEGGKDRELLPLYERLAQLSKAGGSEQSASIFDQKAEEVRGRIGDSPDIKNANDDFVKAKTAAAEATQQADDPAKVREAERQLKAVADRYRAIAGANSASRAEVLTELGAFYSALGRHQEAAASAKEAIKIWEARRDVSNPISVRSVGIVARSTYGDPAAAADFRDAKARLLASTNDTDGKIVSPENAQVLKELVDYMISRGPIGIDSNADVQTMTDRVLTVTRRVHGVGTQKEGEAMELAAAAHLASGRPQQAANVLEQVRNIYALPGLENEYGRASGKLADTYAATGRTDDAENAYKAGLEAMTKPGVQADKAEVQRQLTGYRQMLIRTNQAQKAQRVQMAAMHYAQFGIMPPLNAFGGGND